jgi:hypothetical protein
VQKPSYAVGRSCFVDMEQVAIEFVAEVSDVVIYSLAD